MAIQEIMLPLIYGCFALIAMRKHRHIKVRIKVMEDLLDDKDIEKIKAISLLP